MNNIGPQSSTSTPQLQTTQGVGKKSVSSKGITSVTPQKQIPKHSASSTTPQSKPLAQRNVKPTAVSVSAMKPTANGSQLQSLVNKHKTLKSAKNEAEMQKGSNANQLEAQKAKIIIAGKTLANFADLSSVFESPRGENIKEILMKASTQSATESELNEVVDFIFDHQNKIVDVVKKSTNTLNGDVKDFICNATKGSKKSEFQTTLDQIKELKQKVAEENQSKQEAEDTQNLIAGLQKTIHEQQGTIETLEGTNAHQRDELNALTHETSLQKDTITQLKTSVKGLTEEINKLQQSQMQQTEENQQLQKELATQTAQIQKLTEQNTTLQDTIQGQLDKINQLEDQLQQTHLSDSEINAKLQELTAKNQQLEKQTEVLQQQNQTLIDANQLLENDNQILKDQNQELIQENNQLKQQVAELTNEVSILSSQLTQLRETLADKQSEINHLKTQLQQSEQQNAALSNENAALKNEIDTLNAQQAEKVSSLEDTIAQLQAKSTSEKEGLQDEIDNLKAQLAAAQSVSPQSSSPALSQEIKDLITEERKINLASNGIQSLESVLSSGTCNPRPVVTMTIDGVKYQLAPPDETFKNLDQAKQKEILNDAINMIKNIRSETVTKLKQQHAPLSSLQNDNSESTITNFIMTQLKPDQVNNEQWEAMIKEFKSSVKPRIYFNQGNKNGELS